MNILNPRLYIRQMLRESAILEAQRLNTVNRSIKEFFDNCKFYLNGEEVLSAMAISELKEECAIKTESAIRNIQNSNFPYNNFYGIRLGGFYIKSAGKQLPLTFELVDENPGVFKNFSTSFIVFVYHDFVFKLVPYNEKMATDVTITKEMQNMVNSKQFANIFATSTQTAKLTGEIKILDFDRKNVIITNYFNNLNLKKSVEKDNTPPVKLKKSFRPNSPLVHKLFGKGIIQSTKRIKQDLEGTIYNLIVNFPNFGQKTIQVKIAA